MSKTITGVVSSVASRKTIVIKEHTRKTHPLYKKQYSVTKKFMAHDEKEIAKVGDKVIIETCRPLSARKHYMLKEVIEKAQLSTEDKNVIEEAAKTEEQKAKEAEKAAKAEKEDK